jgi:acetyl-CoA acetyltransferase
LTARIQFPKGKRPVFIGAGNSPCSRYSGRPLASHATQAALNAIEDAGLRPENIDGFCVYPLSPGRSARHEPGLDVVSVQLMLRILHPPLVRWYSEPHLSMAGASVIQAANALASGACNYVLVWRALWHPPGVRYDAIDRTRAGGREQFTLPYGGGQASHAQAMLFTRYLERFGADRDALANIVMNANRNAQDNENSVWRGKIFNADDYASSRLITYPLRMWDCEIPVDGAGAVIMTTEDRARDTPHPGGYIAGYALSNDNVDDAPNFNTSGLETCYEKNALMAKALWEGSGFGPEDIDLIHVYDGFAPMVWNWLETFGFCGAGEAWQWATPERIARSGSHPVNPSGGSLGEGRLHGMAHISETARQMMGTAGPRQLPNVDVALCQVGPFHQATSFVCTRE